MNFEHPVKVYRAGTNLEAQLLVQLLEANDIPAYADEDHSAPGLFMFGTLDAIHRPYVCTEQADAEKARALLEQYEQRNRQRLADVSESDAAAAVAECEECGQESSYPANLAGSTQRCTHCGAYVDVPGDKDEVIGWEEAGDDEDQALDEADD